MLLPSARGSKIQISAHDPMLRRWIEWHGFVIESGNPYTTFTMRRDLPEGAFAHHPEPPRP
jgi:hypothetical protein